MSPVTAITIALDIDGVIVPFVDPRHPLHHVEVTGWSYTDFDAGEPALSPVADPVVQLLFDLEDRDVERAGVEGVEADRGVEAGNPAGSPSAGVPIQVLWHSSWRSGAPRDLAPALGLTRLAGGPERLFATDAEYLGRSSPEDEVDRTWWKLKAVLRWLAEHPVAETGEHELLIWIDDDLADSIDSGEITPELISDPRLVIISPDLFVGIGPAELAQLRALTHL